MVPEYLNQFFNQRTQYEYYEKRKDYVSKIRDIEDRFICLKGFSSSSPLFQASTFQTYGKGGGFYFRFKGIGIAVDPGIEFVQLMHQNNIFIDDINYVIVTHNHMDHNNDVQSLAALFYDYKNFKTKSNSFLNKFFEREEEQQLTIDWYLDRGTKKTCDTYLKDLGSKVFTLDNYVGISEGIKLSDNIAISVCHTEHIWNGKTYSDDTYAIKISFKSDVGSEQVWGYTSDTRFTDEIGDFMKDCNAVILNVSEVYKSEIYGKYKRTHLGLNGSEDLLKLINPKLVLISEFCCVKGDNRHEIVRIIRDSVSKSKMRVLPAEIGMNVSLVEEKITCSQCGKLRKYNDLFAIKPDGEYKQIRYICKECVL